MASSMNMLDKAIAFFSPESGLNRAINRASLSQLKAVDANMDYDATGNGRRSIKAKTNPSAKEVTRRNLVTARKNMRELRRNNAIISAAVEAKTMHTIGTGIRPMLRTDSKSKAKKNKAKQAQLLINRWVKSINSDLYGTSNFFAQQSLAWSTRCSIGEVLIIRQRTIEPKSGLPLQLKMLEGDFLDHTKNGKNETTGNRIIMGVEVDASETPVAYWIFDEHPNEIGFFSRLKTQSRRHDAANVVHLFKPERPGSVRGLPEGLASATRAKNIDEFQDARLNLMKIAACLVGAVTDSSRGQGANNNAAKKVLPGRMTPGAILSLGANQSMDFNTPPSVSGQHEFMVEELHIIAADWKLTYQALIRDLKQVNFTSGRMGWLDMQKGIDLDRDHCIKPMYLEKVWGWLQEALELTGLPVRDLQCDWIPPRREMFDPTREIPPLVKAIRAGLKPMQRALMEQGDDPDVILTQYQEWNDQVDTLKLIFDTDPLRVSGAGNTNPEPTKPEPEDDES